MEGSETADITLADIETMIGILERFVKVSRKAQHLLRSLGAGSGSAKGNFMDKFMEAAMERSGQGGAGLEGEYEEVPLEDNEKAIIDKIRARQGKPTQKP